MKVPDRVEPQVRAVREFFQDQWFDRTRRVHTSGEVTLRAAGVDEAAFQDSEAYQPARPGHIRQALREIGVEDVSAYNYVDLGSGKGRSLFVAAEHGFRSITGVELSPRLHAIASENIRRFRGWSWRGGSDCRTIRSLNMDATQFEFPAGSLVLYMFNPFGVSTVRQVLANLERSLRGERRHVVVVLLWPQWEREVARIEGMRLRGRREEWRIFEVGHG